MLNFFERLTLRAQIGLSFAGLIILLVFATGSAFYGLQLGYKGFVQYRELARDTNLSNEVLSGVLSMRQDVKDYLVSHEESHLAAYGESRDTMIMDLNTALLNIKEPKRAANVVEIEKLTNDYTQTFDAVSELVQREDKLVEEVINRQAN